MINVKETEFLMPNTDLLKLIFHHDQRLDDLSPSEETGNEDPLALFTAPDPTYSTLYFSGTNLVDQQFGINVLSKYDHFIQAIEKGIEGITIATKNGNHETLKAAIETIEMNDALVITNDEVAFDIIHSFTRKMLRDVLTKGWIIVYKREAKNGFDLHIFSKKNIYTQFFYPLKELLPDAFRFFSINGKRLSSEQKFYFETYTLEKPPHGFEEVFPESVL